MPPEAVVFLDTEALKTYNVSKVLKRFGRAFETLLESYPL